MNHFFITSYAYWNEKALEYQNTMRSFPACSKSMQIVIDTGQSIVLLKGKVCLCWSSYYLQVDSFYSSPRCSVLILFQMVTTSNWHEIMNSVRHVTAGVTRLQVCVLYKTRLPVLTKWFCRVGDSLDIFGSLSNDWRRRQRERQKSNRFIEQNNKFTSASRFFVLFFAVTAQLRCGYP